MIVDTNQPKKNMSVKVTMNNNLLPTGMVIDNNWFLNQGIKIPSMPSENCLYGNCDHGKLGNKCEILVLYSDKNSKSKLLPLMSPCNRPFSCPLPENPAKHNISNEKRSLSTADLTLLDDSTFRSFLYINLDSDSSPESPIDVADSNEYEQHLSGPFIKSLRHSISSPKKTKYNETQEFQFYKASRRRNRGKNSKRFGLIKERIDPGGKKVLANDKVIYTNVSSINWKKVNYRRAGVIIYSVINDQLKFCLGVDSHFDTVTDFGGHISHIVDKTAVNAGLREFNEETLGIFGTFSPEQVDKCQVACRGDMMIMFLHLDVDEIEVINAFDKKYEKESDSEIKKLIWIDKESLLESISSGTFCLNDQEYKIYHVVRDFLAELIKEHGDFTKKL